MSIGATGKWLVVLNTLFAMSSVLAGQFEILAGTDTLINVVLAALGLLIGLALVNYEAKLLTCETCPYEQDRAEEKHA